jgi:hypothetical protein
MVSTSTVKSVVASWFLYDSFFIARKLNFVCCSLIPLESMTVKFLKNGSLRIRAFRDMRQIAAGLGWCLQLNTATPKHAFISSCNWAISKPRSSSLISH